MTVDSNKTAALVIKEYRPLSTRYELTNLNGDQVSFFLSQKMISPKVEEALRRVVSQKDNVAALDQEIGSRKGQIASISDDQQRMRENMKALKGSAEEKTLVERYARQFNHQEDEVETLHKQISDLHQKREQVQKALNDLIEGITLEAKI